MRLQLLRDWAPYKVGHVFTDFPAGAAEILIRRGLAREPAGAAEILIRRGLAREVASEKLPVTRKMSFRR